MTGGLGWVHVSNVMGWVGLGWFWISVSWVWVKENRPTANSATHNTDKPSLSTYTYTCDTSERVCYSVKTQNVRCVCDSLHEKRTRLSPSLYPVYRSPFFCRTFVEDFHMMYRQIRSFDSASRRETVSGHRRSGDVPAADHTPPGSTRSAVTALQTCIQHRRSPASAVCWQWPARRSASQTVNIRRTRVLLCRTLSLERTSWLLKNNTLSLSTFRRQLKHFYFSLY